MTNRIRAIEILITFIVGLVPVLWYVPGQIIAKGDYFAYMPNSNMFSNDLSSWSRNNLGNPSPYPAYTFYGILWMIPHLANIDLGIWQIITILICVVGAAFSIFFLTRTLYPGTSLAPIVASIFYVFNFATLNFLLNVGMMWAYAFLPLMMALLIKAITQTSQRYRNIACFALTFSIVGSVASMNVAVNAIIVIALISISLYYLVFDQTTNKTQALKTLGVITVITILASCWWIIPILNYYILSSSTQLMSNVNVLSWSWTHSRASILNLLMLNGGWGWRPEYVPYFGIYTDNPIFNFLLLLPFILASTAIFFRDRRRINSYFILVGAIFIFLAKGLHEPLSNVNLFLYDFVPFMSMFREPISKFTLALIPFLAALVGFSTNKITKSLNHLLPNRRILSYIFAGCVTFMLITSAFPILTNPIETKTQEIPFSSYVKLPSYWNETANWVDSQEGEFKVLITPFDDYYQVPYSWGYFGSDTFIERLIQKPIVNPTSSYQVNPDSVALINQLRDAIKFNRTEEFNTIMSLLNVEYIIQRNDLDFNYIALNNRDMMDSAKMKLFLSSQANIVFVKAIGELDIYKYQGPKTYASLSGLETNQTYQLQITIETRNSTRFDFGSTEQLGQWKESTPAEQFGVPCNLTLDNNTLRFELLESSWGWKTLTSPHLTVRFTLRYTIQFGIKTRDAQGVHIKIFEYDDKMQLIRSQYALSIGDGSLDWQNVEISYEPSNESVKFIQFSIWSGHETSEPLPNIIWIRNVDIEGYQKALNLQSITEMLKAQTDDNSQILSFERVSPSKMIFRINASEAFTLVIDEAYDSSWKAHVNEKTYDSFSVFSVENGFAINDTGVVEVIVSYEPQEWFLWGCATSVGTIAVLLLIPLLNKVNRRLKREKKKVDASGSARALAVSIN